MKNRISIIVTLALVFTLACSLTGGSPTQSAATPEMVYAVPSRVYTPSPTPYIPLTHTPVPPIATPTACEAFESFVEDHNVSEIISYIEQRGAVTQISNGTPVPKGSLFWTLQVKIDVSPELAEIIKSDEFGSMLRILTETIFQVSGHFTEDDPCR